MLKLNRMKINRHLIESQSFTVENYCTQAEADAIEVLMDKGDDLITLQDFDPDTLMITSPYPFELQLQRVSLDKREQLGFFMFSLTILVIIKKSEQQRIEDALAFERWAKSHCKETVETRSGYFEDITSW